MPPKGSTYWTLKRVLAYTGSAGISIVALFSILSMLGYINVTGYSYTEHCAGTPSDLCYLYLNFTPTKDIYVQADSQWLNTNPPIKSIKLQRTWGSSWRTIDLTKPWSTQVKYAVKFAKDQDYQVRFIAEKYHPTDVINWSINPTGVWGEAIATKHDNECVKYKKVKYYEDVNRYKNITTCYNQTYWVKCDDSKIKNGTCPVVQEQCYNQTILDYVESVKKYRQECDKYDTWIQYAETIFKYKEENQVCSVLGSTIVCDDDSTGDGNGDGICQAGETCSYYDLKDKIEFKEKWNGKVKVK